MTSKRIYILQQQVFARREMDEINQRQCKQIYNPLGTNYGRFDAENAPAIPDKPDRHIPYSERKRREAEKRLHPFNNPHGQNQHTKGKDVVELPPPVVKSFREYLRSNRITLEQAADISQVNRHFFGNMFYSAQKMFSVETLNKVKTAFPDFWKKNML